MSPSNNSPKLSSKYIPVKKYDAESSVYSIPKKGFRKKKLSSSGPTSSSDSSLLYSYLKSAAWFFSEPSNFIS